MRMEGPGGSIGAVDDIVWHIGEYIDDFPEEVGDGGFWGNAKNLKWPQHTDAIRIFAMCVAH